jgi:hypothetical protein
MLENNIQYISHKYRYIRYTVIQNSTDANKDENAFSSIFSLLS